MSVEQVIGEAKRLLKTDPFDAGHDLDHHKAVVQNCLDIVRDERLSLDMDVLLIAAWWHDYKRNDEAENDKILAAALIANGFDDAHIARILEIKNCHSFGNGQYSLEAKVLFDADKLEYVSILRVRKVLQAAEDGGMSRETLMKYNVAFRQRTPTIPSLLHFESTKKEFARRLDAFKADYDLVVWLDS